MESIKNQITHYQVPFMEEAGGFIFNFLWNKDTVPAKEEILEKFKEGNDDEESYYGWKDLMIYEELKPFSINDRCRWSEDKKECNQDCWMCPYSNDDAVRETYGITPSDVEWN